MYEDNGLKSRRKHNKRRKMRREKGMRMFRKRSCRKILIIPLLKTNLSVGVSSVGLPDRTLTLYSSLLSRNQPTIKQGREYNFPAWAELTNSPLLIKKSILQLCYVPHSYLFMFFMPVRTFYVMLLIMITYIPMTYPCIMSYGTLRSLDSTTLRFDHISVGPC